MGSDELLKTDRLPFSISSVGSTNSGSFQFCTALPDARPARLHKTPLRASECKNEMLPTNSSSAPVPIVNLYPALLLYFRLTVGQNLDALRN